MALCLTGCLCVFPGNAGVGPIPKSVFDKLSETGQRVCAGMASATEESSSHSGKPVDITKTRELCRHLKNQVLILGLNDAHIFTGVGSSWSPEWVTGEGYTEQNDPARNAGIMGEFVSKL